MKRILLLAGAAALACLSIGPLAAQTQSDQYKYIKTNWTPPTYAKCNFTASPAVNTACINGYQETLTSPVAGASVTLVPPCTATLTTNCIGPVSAYSWTPGIFLYSGTWKITLAVGYLDQNGAQQFTTAASTTLDVPPPFVPPSPVTGLNAGPSATP
jgi:hypothetical protein